MNSILDWFSQKEALNLAEALLHSLWQGALLSFVLYATLRLIPCRCANTRYLFSLFTLFLVVLAIFLTAAVLNYDSPHSVLTNQTTSSPATWGESIREALRSPSTLIPSSNPVASSYSASGPVLSLPWQAWFLSFWMLGAVVMLVRLSVHVSNMQEIRRRSVACDNETVTALVNGLQNSLRITRRIGVAVSDAIASPAVLGVLQPTLLLPLSMVSGLPVDALRAVLVHELAHIRRWDYLVNLMQMLVEALLFFNPAVWWISRQVRLEREACCDATAVHYTGDRAKYVEALLCALQLSQPASLYPALQNLAKESEPSDLLERIRRILQPSFSRKPRMTLLHFSSFLFLCLFLIACMKEGADIAVETASKWFISEEQMQQLVEVEKTYSPLTAYSEGKDTKVIVSGTVRMEDGSALPEKTSIQLFSTFGVGTSGRWSAIMKDGSFTSTVPFGEIYIEGSADGYAPFSAGPYISQPSGSISNLEFVFNKGHEAIIQFTDPQGLPLENVSIAGSAILVMKNGTSGIGQRYEQKSDEQGKVILSQIGNTQYSFSVEVEGYQTDEQKIKLNPDEVYKWTLQPARPTTGIVTSKVTGKPIAGAKLEIVRKEQPQLTGIVHIPATVTDSEGRFTLSSLREDTVYTFFVSAPDHGLLVLSGVRDNQKDIEVQLGSEIVVKGIVTGNLEGVSNNEQVSWENSSPGSYPYFENGAVPLEIRDGVGHFQIENLYPGSLTICFAKQCQEILVKESISDIEIHLPTEPVPTRPVILRLDVPKGGALPQGNIQVNIYQEKTPNHYTQVDHKVFPIQNQEIRLDVPIGFRISYEPQDIVGYSFRSDSPTTVEPGSKPLLIDIPVFPIGSAYGRIVKTDGSPAVGVTIDKITIKTSPIEKRGTHSYTLPMTNPDGTFHLSNLPLAGTYMIFGRLENNVITSQPFTLTDERIMQELSLVLPNGVDLKGQVVDEQSLPISRLPLELIYDEGSTRTLETKYTGVDGSFVFTNLNPNSEHYFINIPSRRDYQPIKQKVDFSENQMQIRVEKGRILTGMVLDQYTKLPIPGIKLQAGATDHSHKDFAHSIQAEAPTNEKGEFRFSNMAPIEYRFFLQDVNSPYDLTAMGGDPNPLTIYATIPEWSSLKPRAPKE